MNVPSVKILGPELLCLQKVRRHTWGQSVPSAVADAYAVGLGLLLRFLYLIRYPSATADGTDRVQVPRPDF